MTIQATRFEPLGICYRVRRSGVAERLDPDEAVDQDLQPDDSLETRDQARRQREEEDEQQRLLAGTDDGGETEDDDRERDRRRPRLEERVQQDLEDRDNLIGEAGQQQGTISAEQRDRLAHQLEDRDSLIGEAGQQQGTISAEQRERLARQLDDRDSLIGEAGQQQGTISAEQRERLPVATSNEGASLGGHTGPSNATAVDLAMASPQMEAYDAQLKKFRPNEPSGGASDANVEAYTAQLKSRFDGQNFGGMSDAQAEAHFAQLKRLADRESPLGRLKDLATASAILFPAGAPARAGAAAGSRALLALLSRRAATKFAAQSALELGADVGVETADRGLAGGPWVPSPQSFAANAPEAVVETIIERILPGYRGSSGPGKFGSTTLNSTVSGGVAEQIAPDFVAPPEGPSYIGQKAGDYLPRNDFVLGSASGFLSGAVMGSPNLVRSLHVPDLHFPRTESGLTVVDAETALRIERNRIGQENANRLDGEALARKATVDRIFAGRPSPTGGDHATHCESLREGAARGRGITVRR